eukprot:1573340-Amphidinium_carterae.2
MSNVLMLVMPRTPSSHSIPVRRFIAFTKPPAYLLPPKRTQGTDPVRWFPDNERDIHLDHPLIPSSGSLPVIALC